MDEEDKIIGCIVGGAIGDCLGRPYENQKEVRLKEEKWKITDDTQMTLATCEAITKSRKVDPEIIAKAFVQWHRREPFRGLGASTYKALLELSQGGHWALVGRKGEMAAGNGAAMRIAPLAFCLDVDDKQTKIVIRDVSRITHHNEEAYVGALAVVIAIRCAWKETPNLDNSLFSTLIDKLPDSSIRDRLIDISKLDNNLSISEIAKIYGSSGYVVETIPLVIYSLNYFQKLGFQPLLQELVTLGGDSDTIASITGQIIGSSIGFNALPKDLVNSLPTSDNIFTIAKNFAKVVIEMAA